MFSHWWNPRARQQPGEEKPRLFETLLITTIGASRERRENFLFESPVTH
jgi:hypothetical protein